MEAPWFRAKRYGYGAGLPLARQGWVVLGALIVTIILTLKLARQAIRLMAAAPAYGTLYALLTLLAGAATLLLLRLVARHTEGGSQWRRDGD